MRIPDGRLPPAAVFFFLDAFIVDALLAIERLERLIRAQLAHAFAVVAFVEQQQLLFFFGFFGRS